MGFHTAALVASDSCEGQKLQLFTFTTKNVGTGEEKFNMAFR